MLNALKVPISLIRIFVSWWTLCVGLMILAMVNVLVVILDSLFLLMASVRYQRCKISIQIVRNLLMDNVFSVLLDSLKIQMDFVRLLIHSARIIMK